MSKLLEHARSEMQRAGLYKDDANYGAGEIAKCVERMIETFSSFGHSGGSAAMTLAVFDRVVRFDTLTPITTDPAEWMEISDEDGVWQNRRKPSVFSHDAGATHHDVDDPERKTRPSSSP